MDDDVLADALKKKAEASAPRSGSTEVLSQDEIDMLLTAIDPADSVRAEKRRFLSFADLVYAEDRVLREIAHRVTVDELAKALIREDTALRQAFYRNMPLDSLKILDEKLKTLESFEVKEKTAAQRKILALAAKAPAYAGFRLEDRFDDAETFAAYLTWRRPQEEQPYGYGLFEKDVTVCRFFDTENAENLLADIERKNRADNMGNIAVPGTNIRLINFSVCPKCGHIFSFKDLREYYLHPRPDPAFKNQAEQFRNDTRAFCGECGTYFLPALVIADGTPKTETQFLCRTQTMHAIEDFYAKKKGLQVLSRRAANRVRKNRNCTGILNDALLKEMEPNPTLITNLLQYTPANLALNLIDGSNVRKDDLLYGEWR